MNVIDCHTHFWDLTTGMNSWVIKLNNPKWNKNYLPSNLINQSKANLYGVVHIEAHDSEISTFKEIEWLEKVMDETPMLKYAHIACIDLTLPNSEFKNILAQLKKYPQVVGVRHILSHNPKFDYSPCDSDLSNHKNIKGNIDSLANNGLIFNCQMYPYQLKNILPIIKFSKVKCVIDHTILPAWNQDGDDDHKTWQNLIIELAQLDNIYIKLSKLEKFKAESEFKNILTFCFDNFPMCRLIYATNYPVSFTDDYNYWYEYLNKLNLSDINKEQLFFKNAAKFFFND